MSAGEVFRAAGRPVEARVADLLGRMTPRERLAQLCGVIFPWGRFPVSFGADGALRREAAYDAATEQGLGGLCYVNMSIGPRESAAYTNALQADIRARTRLGVPLLVFEECCHGQLAQEATVFPLPPGLAASFDPELVERVFRAVGRETRARGGHVAFSPVLDLGRDARWGRSEETFGEDTFLAARMGVAAVRGLQGGPSGVEPGFVAACPKHYAGFGQSAGGRQLAPTDLPPRVLRDEILPPFRAALVEGGAEALMGAYTDIDGTPCHANRWLLDALPRGEWGWRGLFIADFSAVRDLWRRYRLAEDRAEAARIALGAGVDMDLPAGECFAELAAAVEADAALRERVDEACGRVLALKFKLGLFENPFTTERAALELTHHAEHRALALRAAERSAVLLKNEGGLLPLERGRARRVAVIGPHGRYLQFGGVSPHDRGVNILDGLRAHLGADAVVEFAQGCALTDRDEPLAYLQETAAGDFQTLREQAFGGGPQGERPREVPLALERGLIEEAARLAARSDVVVLCVGDSQQCAGENFAPTRFGDRTRLDLPGNQLELSRAVKAAGRPVVACVVHGRALALGAVLDAADAVLDLFNPGEARGEAVARLLFGDVEPTGRLPLTVPHEAGQLPVYYSQKPHAYLRDYAFTQGRWRLPFGFGLGYTRFEWAEPRLERAEIRAGEEAVVTVEATNVGARAGETVAQVYLSIRRDEVTRPERWLAGFARLTAGPGETARARIVIGREAFERTGSDLRRAVAAGDYVVGAGPDCATLRETGLRVLNAFSRGAV